MAATLHGAIFAVVKAAVDRGAAEATRKAPGMKTTPIARRLGQDGNPLRRRIDKIAACAAALLLAVFLAGAPFLSMAAAG